jgi:maltose alpha-D-glucosyltransferase/alpha-amylase
MLAVRSRHSAFGRGTLTLLYPKNRKILAYLRNYGGDTLLCVANVSHSPQAVELDLSLFATRVPVELNAGTLFPPIGELPYLLTLPPFGFYWFALAPASDWPSWHSPAPEPLPEYITVVMRGGLFETLQTPSRALIEDEALPPYLIKRRWFGLKDETLEAAKIVNVTDIGGDNRELLFAEIETVTDSGKSRWLLPLAVLREDEPATALPNRLALARVRRGRQPGLLTDAFAVPDFAHRVLGAMQESLNFNNAEGTLSFRPTDTGLQVLGNGANGDVNWLTAEQSNSSLTVGDSIMLKIFRRISAGQHPEAEMNGYLTANGFSNAPYLVGDVVQIRSDGTPHTLAVALCFVRNQGDAWSWILEQLKRTTDTLAPDNSAELDPLKDCIAVCSIIGRRLGEMHQILTLPTEDQAFAPEIAEAEDVKRWASKTEQRLEKAFASIEKFAEWKWEQDRECQKSLLKLRSRIVTAVRSLAKSGAGTIMTRIHGDFHLGQVLVASGDAYIIDFEGEPATSIAERRAKSSPLRDVAGLLRSIDYAAATLTDRKQLANSPSVEEQRNRTVTEFRTQASRAFLKDYWIGRAVNPSPAERLLLDLFLIEKAAYEIVYEASNRPTWLGVPLTGLNTLARRVVDKDGGAQNG